MIGSMQNDQVMSSASGDVMWLSPGVLQPVPGPTGNIRSVVALPPTAAGSSPILFTVSYPSLFYPLRWAVLAKSGRALQAGSVKLLDELGQPAGKLGPTQFGVGMHAWDAAYTEFTWGSPLPASQQLSFRLVAGSPGVPVWGGAIVNCQVLWNVSHFGLLSDGNRSVVLSMRGAVTTMVDVINSLSRMAHMPGLDLSIPASSYRLGTSIHVVAHSPSLWVAVSASQSASATIDGSAQSGALLLLQYAPAYGSRLPIFVRAYSIPHLPSSAGPAQSLISSVNHTRLAAGYTLVKPRSTGAPSACSVALVQSSTRNTTWLFCMLLSPDPPVMLTWLEDVQISWTAMLNIMPSPAIPASLETAAAVYEGVRRQEPAPESTSSPAHRVRAIPGCEPEVVPWLRDCYALPTSTAPASTCALQPTLHLNIGMELTGSSGATHNPPLVYFSSQTQYASLPVLLGEVVDRSVIRQAVVQGDALTSSILVQWIPSDAGGPVTISMFGLLTSLAQGRVLIAPEWEAVCAGRCGFGTAIAAVGPTSDVRVWQLVITAPRAPEYANNSGGVWVLDINVSTRTIATTAPVAFTPGLPLNGSCGHAIGAAVAADPANAWLAITCRADEQWPTVLVAQSTRSLWVAGVVHTLDTRAWPGAAEFAATDFGHTLHLGPLVDQSHTLFISAPAAPNVVGSQGGVVLTAQLDSFSGSLSPLRRLFPVASPADDAACSYSLSFWPNAGAMARVVQVLPGRSMRLPEGTLAVLLHFAQLTPNLRQMSSKWAAAGTPTAGLALAQVAIQRGSTPMIQAWWPNIPESGRVLHGLLFRAFDSTANPGVLVLPEAGAPSSLWLRPDIGVNPPPMPAIWQALNPTDTVETNASNTALLQQLTLSAPAYARNFSVGSAILHLADTGVASPSVDVVLSCDGSGDVLGLHLARVDPVMPNITLRALHSGDTLFWSCHAAQFTGALFGFAMQAVAHPNSQADSLLVGSPGYLGAGGLFYVQLNSSHIQRVQLVAGGMNTVLTASGIDGSLVAMGLATAAGWLITPGADFGSAIAAMHSATQGFDLVVLVGAPGALHAQAGPPGSTELGANSGPRSGPNSGAVFVLQCKFDALADSSVGLVVSGTSVVAPGLPSTTSIPSQLYGSHTRWGSSIAVLFPGRNDAHVSDYRFLISGAASDAVPTGVLDEIRFNAIWTSATWQRRVLGAPSQPQNASATFPGARSCAAAWHCAPRVQADSVAEARLWRTTVQLPWVSVAGRVLHGATLDLRWDSETYAYAVLEPGVTRGPDGAAIQLVPTRDGRLPTAMLYLGSASSVMYLGLYAGAGQSGTGQLVVYYNSTFLGSSEEQGVLARRTQPRVLPSCAEVTPWVNWTQVYTVKFLDMVELNVGGHWPGVHGLLALTADGALQLVRAQPEKIVSLATLSHSDIIAALVVPTLGSMTMAPLGDMLGVGIDQAVLGLPELGGYVGGAAVVAVDVSAQLYASQVALLSAADVSIPGCTGYGQFTLAAVTGLNSALVMLQTLNASCSSVLLSFSWNNATQSVTNVDRVELTPYAGSNVSAQHAGLAWLAMPHPDKTTSAAAVGMIINGQLQIALAVIRHGQLGVNWGPAPLSPSAPSSCRDMMTAALLLNGVLSNGLPIATTAAPRNLPILVHSVSRNRLGVSAYMLHLSPSNTSVIDKIELLPVARAAAGAPHAPVRARFLPRMGMLALRSGSGSHVVLQGTPRVAMARATPLCTDRCSSPIISVQTSPMGHPSSFATSEWPADFRAQSMANIGYWAGVPVVALAGTTGARAAIGILGVGGDTSTAVHPLWFRLLPQGWPERTRSSVPIVHVSVHSCSLVRSNDGLHSVVVMLSQNARSVAMLLSMQLNGMALQHVFTLATGTLPHYSLALCSPATDKLHVLSVRGPAGAALVSAITVSPASTAERWDVATAVRSVAMLAGAEIRLGRAAFPHVPTDTAPYAMFVSSNALHLAQVDAGGKLTVELRINSSAATCGNGTMRSLNLLTAMPPVAPSTLSPILAQRDSQMVLLWTTPCAQWSMVNVPSSLPRFPNNSLLASAPLQLPVSGGTQRYLVLFKPTSAGPALATLEVASPAEQLSVLAPLEPVPGVRAYASITQESSFSGFSDSPTWLYVRTSPGELLPIPGNMNNLRAPLLASRSGLGTELRQFGRGNPGLMTFISLAPNATLQLPGGGVETGAIVLHDLQQGALGGEASLAPATQLSVLPVHYLVSALEITECGSPTAVALDASFGESRATAVAVVVIRCTTGTVGAMLWQNTDSRRSIRATVLFQANRPLDTATLPLPNNSIAALPCQPSHVALQQQGDTVWSVVLPCLSARSASAGYSWWQLLLQAPAGLDNLTTAVLHMQNLTADPVVVKAGLQPLTQTANTYCMSAGDWNGDGISLDVMCFVQDAPQRTLVILGLAWSSASVLWAHQTTRFSRMGKLLSAAQNAMLPESSVMLWSEFLDPRTANFVHTSMRADDATAFPGVGLTYNVLSAAWVSEPSGASRLSWMLLVDERNQWALYELKFGSVPGSGARAWASSLALSSTAPVWSSSSWSPLAPRLTTGLVPAAATACRPPIVVAHVTSPLGSPKTLLAMTCQDETRGVHSVTAALLTDESMQVAVLHRLTLADVIAAGVWSGQGTAFDTLFGVTLASAQLCTCAQAELTCAVLFVGAPPRRGMLGAASAGAVLAARIGGDGRILGWQELLSEHVVPAGVDAAAVAPGSGLGWGLTSTVLSSSKLRVWAGAPFAGADNAGIVVSMKVRVPARGLLSVMGVEHLVSEGGPDSTFGFGLAYTSVHGLTGVLAVGTPGGAMNQWAWPTPTGAPLLRLGARNAVEFWKCSLGESCAVIRVLIRAISTVMPHLSEGELMVINHGSWLTGLSTLPQAVPRLGIWVMPGDDVPARGCRTIMAQVDLSGEPTAVQEARPAAGPGQIVNTRLGNELVALPLANGTTVLANVGFTASGVTPIVEYSGVSPPVQTVSKAPMQWLAMGDQRTAVRNCSVDLASITGIVDLEPNVNAVVALPGAGPDTDSLLLLVPAYHSSIGTGLAMTDVASSACDFMGWVHPDNLLGQKEWSTTAVVAIPDVTGDGLDDLAVLAIPTDRDLSNVYAITVAKRSLSVNVAKLGSVSQTNLDIAPVVSALNGRRIVALAIAQDAFSCGDNNVWISHVLEYSEMRAWEAWGGLQPKDQVIMPVLAGDSCSSGNATWLPWAWPNIETEPGHLLLAGASMASAPAQHGTWLAVLAPHALWKFSPAQGAIALYFLEARCAQAVPGCTLSNRATQWDVHPRGIVGLSTLGWSRPQLDVAASTIQAAMAVQLSSSHTVVLTAHVQVPAGSSSQFEQRLIDFEVSASSGDVQAARLRYASSSTKLGVYMSDSDLLIAQDQFTDVQTLQLARRGLSPSEAVSAACVNTTAQELNLLPRSSMGTVVNASYVGLRCFGGAFTVLQSRAAEAGTVQSLVPWQPASSSVQHTRALTWYALPAVDNAWSKMLLAVNLAELHWQDSVLRAAWLGDGLHCLTFGARAMAYDPDAEAVFSSCYDPATATLSFAALKDAPLARMTSPTLHHVPHSAQGYTPELVGEIMSEAWLSVGPSTWAWFAVVAGTGGVPAHLRFGVLWNGTAAWSAAPSLASPWTVHSTGYLDSQWSQALPGMQALDITAWPSVHAPAFLILAQDTAYATRLVHAAVQWDASALQPALTYRELQWASNACQPMELSRKQLPAGQFFRGTATPIEPASAGAVQVVLRERASRLWVVHVNITHVTKVARMIAHVSVEQLPSIMPVSVTAARNTGQAVLGLVDSQDVPIVAWMTSSMDLRAPGVCSSASQDAATRPALTRPAPAFSAALHNHPQADPAAVLGNPNLIAVPDATDWPAAFVDRTRDNETVLVALSRDAEAGVAVARVDSAARIVSWTMLRAALDENPAWIVSSVAAVPWKTGYLVLAGFPSAYAANGHAQGAVYAWQITESGFELDAYRVSLCDLPFVGNIPGNVDVTGNQQCGTGLASAAVRRSASATNSFVAFSAPGFPDPARATTGKIWLTKIVEFAGRGLPQTAIVVQVPGLDGFVAGTAFPAGMQGVLGTHLAMAAAADLKLHVYFSYNVRKLGRILYNIESDEVDVSSVSPLPSSLPSMELGPITGLHATALLQGSMSVVQVQVLRGSVGLPGHHIVEFEGVQGSILRDANASFLANSTDQLLLAWDTASGARRELWRNHRAHAYMLHGFVEAQLPAAPAPQLGTPRASSKVALGPSARWRAAWSATQHPALAGWANGTTPGQRARLAVPLYAENGQVAVAVAGSSSPTAMTLDIVLANASTWQPTALYQHNSANLMSQLAPLLTSSARSSLQLGINSMVAVPDISNDGLPDLAVLFYEPRVPGMLLTVWSIASTGRILSVQAPWAMQAGVEEWLNQPATQFSSAPAGPFSATVMTDSAAARGNMSGSMSHTVVTMVPSSSALSSSSAIITVNACGNPDMTPSPLWSEPACVAQIDGAGCTEIQYSQQGAGPARTQVGQWLQMHCAGRRAATPPVIECYLLHAIRSSALHGVARVQFQIDTQAWTIVGLLDSPALPSSVVPLLPAVPSAMPIGTWQSLADTAKVLWAADSVGQLARGPALGLPASQDGLLPDFGSAVYTQSLMLAVRGSQSRLPTRVLRIAPPGPGILPNGSSITGAAWLSDFTGSTGRAAFCASVQVDDNAPSLLLVGELQRQDAMQLKPRYGWGVTDHAHGLGSCEQFVPGTREASIESALHAADSKTGAAAPLWQSSLDWHGVGPVAQLGGCSWGGDFGTAQALFGTQRNASEFIVAGLDGAVRRVNLPQPSSWHGHAQVHVVLQLQVGSVTMILVGQPGVRVGSSNSSGVLQAIPASALSTPSTALTLYQPGSVSQWCARVLDQGAAIEYTGLGQLLLPVQLNANQSVVLALVQVKSSGRWARELWVFHFLAGLPWPSEKFPVNAIPRVSAPHRLAVEAIHGTVPPATAVVWDVDVRTAERTVLRVLIAPNPAIVQVWGLSFTPGMPMLVGRWQIQQLIRAGAAATCALCSDIAFPTGVRLLASIPDEDGDGQRELLVQHPVTHDIHVVYLLYNGRPRAQRALQVREAVQAKFGGDARNFSSAAAAVAQLLQNNDTRLAVTFPGLKPHPSAPSGTLLLVRLAGPGIPGTASPLHRGLAFNPVCTPAASSIGQAITVPLQPSAHPMVSPTSSASPLPSASAVPSASPMPSASAAPVQPVRFQVSSVQLAALQVPARLSTSQEVGLRHSALAVQLSSDSASITASLQPNSTRWHHELQQWMSSVLLVAQLTPERAADVSLAKLQGTITASVTDGSGQYAAATLAVTADVQRPHVIVSPSSVLTPVPPAEIAHAALVLSNVGPVGAHVMLNITQDVPGYAAHRGTFIVNGAEVLHAGVLVPAGSTLVVPLKVAARRLDRRAPLLYGMYACYIRARVDPGVLLQTSASQQTEPAQQRLASPWYVKVTSLLVCPAEARVILAGQRTVQLPMWAHGMRYGHDQNVTWELGSASLRSGSLPAVIPAYTAPLAGSFSLVAQRASSPGLAVPLTAKLHNMSAFVASAGAGTDTSVITVRELAVAGNVHVGESVVHNVPVQVPSSVGVAAVHMQLRDGNGWATSQEVAAVQVSAGLLTAAGTMLALDSEQSSAAHHTTVLSYVLPQPGVFLAQAALHGVPMGTDLVSSIVPAYCPGQAERASITGIGCVCVPGAGSNGTGLAATAAGACQWCAAGSGSSAVQFQTSSRSIDSFVCRACPRGTFSLPGGVGGPAAGVCRPCLVQGAECASGQLRFLPGYYPDPGLHWRDVDTSTALYECPNTAACKVEANLSTLVSSAARRLASAPELVLSSVKCSNGYRGALCGACDDGWVHQSRVCVNCADVAFPVLGTVLLALLLLAAMVAVTLRPSTAGNNLQSIDMQLPVVVRTATTWVQAMSVVFAASTRLPAALSAIGVGVGTTTEASIAELSVVACALELGALGKMWMTVALIALLALACVAAAWAGYGVAIHLRASRQGRSRDPRYARVLSILPQTRQETVSRVSAALVLLLSTTYAAVLKQVLGLYVLTPKFSTGEQFMWTDTAVRALSPGYVVSSIAGAPLLVLLVVVVPAGAGLLLLRNMSRLQSKRFASVWLPLYEGYRQDEWKAAAWEVSVLLRKAALAAAAVLLPAGLLKLQVLAGVLWLHAALSIAVRPYLNWSTGVLEIAGSTVACLCGLLLAYAESTASIFQLVYAGSAPAGPQQLYDIRITAVFVTCTVMSALALAAFVAAAWNSASSQMHSTVLRWYNMASAAQQGFQQAVRARSQQRTASKASKLSLEDGQETQFASVNPAQAARAQQGHRARVTRAGQPEQSSKPVGEETPVFSSVNPFSRPGHARAAAAAAAAAGQTSSQVWSVLGSNAGPQHGTKDTARAVPSSPLVTQLVRPSPMSEGEDGTFGASNPLAPYRPGTARPIAGASRQAQQDRLEMQRAFGASHARRK